MKLYDNTFAPNPRRVRIFLAEKGISLPIVPVDLIRNETQSEDFLRKNCLGKVPVLELDDGTFLSESVAICRYLEELHPEPSLLGRTPLERAHIEMWCRRMEFELWKSVGDTFRNLHPFFEKKTTQVPRWGEVSRERAQTLYAWLDTVLEASAFIAGNQYTLADIMALCAIDFGRAVEIQILPEQKELQRWHAAVSARPSARA